MLCNYYKAFGKTDKWFITLYSISHCIYIKIYGIVYGILSPKAHMYHIKQQVNTYCITTNVCPKMDIKIQFLQHIVTIQVATLHNEVKSYFFNPKKLFLTLQWLYIIIFSFSYYSNSERYFANLLIYVL